LGIEAFNQPFNPLTLNESKAVMVCIDSFKMQTMIAFNQKFLRGGSSGGSFFKKRPSWPPEANLTSIEKISSFL
jgi:hypothetical protein